MIRSKYPRGSPVFEPSQLLRRISSVMKIRIQGTESVYFDMENETHSQYLAYLPRFFA